MADSTLRLIIDTLFKGDQNLKDAKEQVEKVGEAAETAGTKAKDSGSKWDSLMGSFTGINQAIGLAKEAYATLKGVYEVVVGDTVAYAEQVRELSRTIGATPEDASKLIQAADDVKVSFSSLSTAMNIAIKNGLDPTIDGMGALADEYLSIQDPIKRTKFLLENFGRSGADLAPLMELGAEGIKELGDAAEDTGLVLGQDALDATREYEKAVDSLCDTWKGLTTQLGKAVIPAIVDVIDAVNENITTIDLNKETMDKLKAAEEAGVITKKEYRQVQHDVMLAVKSNQDPTDLLIQATKDLDAASLAAGQTVDMTAESLIAQSIAAAQAKTDTENLTAATLSADEATRAYSESLLFAIASEGLDAEAALQLAYKMGLVDEKTVYATEKINTWSQMLNNGEIDLETYNALVKGLNDSLEGLPSDVNVDVSMALRTDDVDRYLANLNRSVTIPVYFGVVSGANQPQAVGGSVYEGNPYNWQEYGYRGELFVPSSNGFVLSRADAERAISSAIVNSKNGGGSQIDAKEIGRAVAQAMSGVTAKGNGGNVYNLTMPTSNNPADVRTAFELMEAWA